MRFVDVFAGIGGMSLGLERAGHSCVGQVELDAFRRGRLAVVWPDVLRFDDVRGVRGDEFGPFELLVACYPCGPFSLAGERRGEKDPRHLWPEVRRLVRAVRPRFVLLENVIGHRSLGFGEVLGDLAESGFDAQWDCIPAAAVGAPHRRDRVFIVAYPHGESEPVVFPRGGTKGGRAVARGEVAALDVVDEGRGVLDAGGWLLEPGVGRVVDGVPDRVHRLRALGDAVVPQVAEFLGRRLPL